MLTSTIKHMALPVPQREPTLAETGLPELDGAAVSGGRDPYVGQGRL